MTRKESILTEPQEVVAYRTGEGEHNTLVKVVCPFCERWHHHGVPHADTLPTNRLAHCGGGPARTYNITRIAEGVL